MICARPEAQSCQLQITQGHNTLRLKGPSRDQVPLLLCASLPKTLDFISANDNTTSPHL